MLSKPTTAGARLDSFKKTFASNDCNGVGGFISTFFSQAAEFEWIGSNRPKQMNRNIGVTVTIEQEEEGVTSLKREKAGHASSLSLLLQLVPRS